MNTNAVILRGLLAEPSGNENVPWRPVVLGTLTTPEAIEYAREVAGGATCPAPINVTRSPLRLSITAETGAPEQIKEALAAALAEYRAEQQGAAPELFCLPGAGLIYVAEPPAESSTAVPFGTAPIRNRIAVVTGAAGAIGHGVCRGLLEAGAHVAAMDLAGENLDRLGKEFEADFPGRVLPVAMDVTSDASVAEAFARVCAAWGGLDILIINAGIAHVAALTELPLETFQRLERVNVEGTLLTLAEGSRLMQLQGTGGDIVLVSTKNVFAPGARFGAYSATKAASHQLARIASLELAPFDIRVNMVAPDGVFSDEGKVKSGLWATVGPDRMKARGLSEQGLEDYYRDRNLLKLRVTARHVANGVLFFVTRQTPTTGATLPIDGGLPDATPR